MGKFSLLRVLSPLYDGVRVAQLDSSRDTSCALLDMSNFDAVVSHRPLEDVPRDVIANASATSQPTISFEAQHRRTTM